MRVGVIGASGFLGGEVIRLLELHPAFRLTLAGGEGSAGKSLAAVRPGLAKPPIQIERPDAEVIAAECDAVILALPHGESAPLAEELLRRGLTLVDLGSDFRLKDPEETRRWHGREAPRKKLLEAAWYGLPEITGPPPEGTKLVANPGCFATALCLLLAPLAPLGLERVPVFGMTGSSGSGIQPSLNVHHSLRSSEFKAYKPLVHQHLGEVGQLLAGRGWKPQIDFVPHSAPVARGIHITAILPWPWSEVRPLYEAAYGGRPFVSLQDGPVSMGAVVGSNRCAIGGSESDGSCAVFAALDNLIKGGSGQGLQNLNLLAGLPEDTGLPVNGTWP